MRWDVNDKMNQNQEETGDADGMQQEHIEHRVVRDFV